MYRVRPFATLLGWVGGAGTQVDMTGFDAMSPAWWSSFPADADPRPLILYGHRVSPPGFATSEAKLAWLDGAVTVTAEVPCAVVHTVSAAPHGTPDDHVDRVVLNRGARIEYPLLTDRGDVMLPAWRLHGPDLLEDGCIALDPTAHTWWALDDHPEAAAIAGGMAVVDKSGRHVRWPGSC